jgi:hypothetical protein
MPATAVKAVLALVPCTIRQQQKAAIRLIYKGLCQSIFVGKNAINSNQSCKFHGTLGSKTTIIMLPQGSVTMVQVAAFLCGVAPECDLGCSSLSLFVTILSRYNLNE